MGTNEFADEFVQHRRMLGGRYCIVASLQCGLCIQLPKPRDVTGDEPNDDLCHALSFTVTLVQKMRSALSGS